MVTNPFNNVKTGTIYNQYWKMTLLKYKETIRWYRPMNKKAKRQTVKCVINERDKAFETSWSSFSIIIKLGKWLKAITPSIELPAVINAIIPKWAGSNNLAVIKEASIGITDVSNDPPIKTEKCLAVVTLTSLFKYRFSS